MALAVGKLLSIRIQAHRVMSGVPSQSVNGLVSRNRVEPGPNRPYRLVLLCLLIQLEESVLKHIFRQSSSTELATQISVQLPLTAPDQAPERLRLALPKLGQQVLVGAMI